MSAILAMAIMRKNKKFPIWKSTNAYNWKMNYKCHFCDGNYAKQQTIPKLKKKKIQLKVFSYGLSRSIGNLKIHYSN